MTAPAAGPARLGWYVKQRRTKKRLSQAAAARLAGFSRPVWSSIEKGLSNDPYETTYVGVEEALDWASGSCEDVRAGGEPTLIEASGDQPDQAALMAAAINRASDEELYKAGIERHEIATVRAVAEKIERNGVPGEFRAVGT